MMKFVPIRTLRAILLLVPLALVPPLAFTGCVTEPITGRSQLALISESDANELGLQAFSQVVGETKLSGDPQAIAQVDQVVHRIAVATDIRMAAEGRDRFRWEVRVIDDPQMINAFALPGGKMAVYTGILPVARDDTGLAVVLGHEVAHAYAQHGRKRISEGALEQLTLEVAQAALEGQVSQEIQGLILAGLGIGMALGVALPFSRGDESAADEIGLILMAEAGYDPQEAVGFWERMEAAAGNGPPQFLSTHPSPENRIARLKELMPKALEVYGRSRLPAGGGGTEPIVH